MPKTIIINDIKPQFGIRFDSNIFSYEKGVLKLRNPINKKQADQLSQKELRNICYFIKNHSDLQRKNPLKYGWNLPIWNRILENWIGDEVKIFVIFGGNRATKSTWSSRVCAWVAVNVPGSKIRCFHNDASRSIEDQHHMIYEALPEHIKHDRSGDMKWTQKNGFSKAKAVLPVKPGYQYGSEIMFSTYAQYIQNPQKFDGSVADVTWFSEEAPLELFKRFIARTADYKGKIILDFTTIRQWTDLVEELLIDAKTVKKRYAKLIKEELPIEQISGKYPNARIYYFWSEDNKFVDLSDLFNTHQNATIEEKKTIFYGIPSKTFRSTFEGFDEKKHVIAYSEIPFIKNPDLPSTLYMSVDPAPEKKWVMIWAGTFEDKIYVYREYPDLDNFGMWALPNQKTSSTGVTRPLGKPGPAQKGSGLGTKDYAQLIKKIEKANKEKPYRIIDPRGCEVRSSQTDGGIITVQSQLSNEGLYFGKGSGVRIEIGIQTIVDFIAEDRLFIADRCQNLISCIKNFTNCGITEQYKDFIDTLRYLLLANPAPYKSNAYSSFKNYKISGY